MSSPLHILQQYWGFTHFRARQEAIINDVLAGKDILALLPTGGGKSICYQLPALMMDGVCLVVSPLIALMQDQVERLHKQGIQAACIHAGMHFTDVKRILENTVHGGYKLLYVSPERLQTDLFNEYLPAIHISFIAVDEAHCISQWGHDFRPDYLKIADLRNLFDEVPVLALTATATEAVQNDIAQQLQLKQPILYTQGFERVNIFYAVHYTENKQAALIQALKEATTSNIIYCRSRKQTEVLVHYLQQHNITAIAYHAGMAKDKREDAQTAWMKNEVRTIIATTAFGMGIDKPDVGLVVNYDAPEHIEAYYQEGGRAGRDNKPATSVILYNSTDINKLKNSTDILYPDADYLRHIYQCVAEYLQIPISAEPHRYYDFDLKDFCEKFKLDASIAANALKLLSQEGLWTLTEAVFNPPNVLLTVNRQELDNIISTYPELAYPITTLLRLYGTLFQYPTAIRLATIAKQLKLHKQETEQILHRLHRMAVIEYVPQKEGPQLFFHHYRVDSKTLIINTNRINKLKKRHEERTYAILNYLQNDDKCRTQMLLSYFGEHKEALCGHCDYCLKNSSSNFSYKDISNLIFNHLEKAIDINTLIAHFPNSERNTIVSNIRKMADERLITIHPNGTITKNTNK